MLLVVFPTAYGVILDALYLTVALMLVTLSLRGVAFDFWAKAKTHHRPFVGQNLLHPFFAGLMVGRF
jgi:cytochrome d ubiquinol oxidase subunit II